ncbi:MAG: MFS transporter [Planctomycetota bacterium]|nr:MFS transporter [Planctomycetota bacterium]
MPPSTSFRWSTAWLVVVLLAPVAFLNYLDRQMLASMKTSVMSDITDMVHEADWGYMLGQFKWVYAFLSPIGGLIADRFGRRHVICASLFAWSLITWLTGEVTTYQELLHARTLMGISEAFYIPAALALISDHHQGSTRSRAVGIHQTAIYFGVIAGGFGGIAADSPTVGWRTAFTICGMAGLLYTVPLFLLLREGPAIIQQETTTSKRLPLFSSLTSLMTNVSFLLLVLYFTLPALAGWVVRDWMPAILKERYGIGQGLAGISATIYWQAAAIVSALGGGILADRWSRSSSRSRIYVSAIGMVLIVPAILGIGFAGSLTTAIMCLILFGIGWGLFDGNNMPILCQIAPPQLRATGYGIMNLVSISCGGLADWGFGELRDRQVPLHIIFAIFASLAAASAGLVLLIQTDKEIGKKPSSDRN